jgi:hypothetical protein
MGERRGGRLPRGFGAGAVGTLALTALEPLRDSLLGHRAPYAANHIASRMARRWLGVRLGPRAAWRWGLALRWVYGPTLGLLHAWLRPVFPRRAGPRGLLLGGGVWLLERLSFPLLGVTSPPRTWSRAEHALLALQTSVFGLVTESVLSHWRTGSPQAGRQQGGVRPALAPTESPSPP